MRQRTANVSQWLTVPSVESAPASARPLPLFGRAEALTRLCDGAASVQLVTGPAGVGKSAVVRAALDATARLDAPEARVTCRGAGDHRAVAARIDGALRGAGGLPALSAGGATIVVDDLDCLADSEAARLVAAVGALAASDSRVLFIGRHVPRGTKLAPLVLAGLKEPHARNLWDELQSRHGAAPAGSFERAALATRSEPLGLRREFARAVHGENAWHIDSLTQDERALLHAVASLDGPASAELLALVVGEPVAGASLHALCERQLIDVCAGGMFEISDEVRQLVHESSEVTREARTRRTQLEALGEKGLLTSVDAEGVRSPLPDVSDALSSARSLIVDAVNQRLHVAGTDIDLRRRTMLKKLLFLFASAPGRTFPKHEIVETVWGVEYHPLRHDAALFTNIMRLRRLLGEDGDRHLQVSEDGYFLVPPADFLYLSAA